MGQGNVTNIKPHFYKIILYIFLFQRFKRKTKTIMKRRRNRVAKHSVENFSVKIADQIVGFIQKLCYSIYIFFRICLSFYVVDIASLMNFLIHLKF